MRHVTGSRHLLLATVIAAGLLAAQPSTVAAQDNASDGIENTGFSRDDDGLDFSQEGQSQLEDEEGGGRPPATTEVSAADPPDYFYLQIGAAQNQTVCWRIRGAVGGITDPRHQFDTWGDTLAAAEDYYTPQVTAGSMDLTPDDLATLTATPQCQDQVEAGPTISPLQVAMMYWQTRVEMPVPSINVVPEEHDYSLVGLPTILQIPAHNPSGDIDSDPRTVTWDFGSIQLRATAHHKIDWADEHVDTRDSSTDWRATNGRGYQPGDEYGEYDDPQPLAHIYQWADTYPITASARWTGEWRNAGGAWEPLPVAPIVRTSTTEWTVHELQAVVTD